MRIRLETVGCRLNIGEIDSIARRLAAAGHRIVAAGDRAELCILNSCTVTAEASRSSRQAIRRLRRHHPDATLAVTGCYSEIEAEGARAAGADIVIPNRDKDQIVERLTAAGVLREDEAPILSAPGDDPPPTRTRAFVKVQDGCDNRCTFCIVTVARGRAHSRPQEEVVAEAKSLCEAGVHEIVLTGVHLGSYGHDAGLRHGLEHLIARVLAETDVSRLRLSSLEPWDLEPAFFGLFAEARLQPHVHLPLQSGCDHTLRRMARRTTTADYAALVESARACVPDLAVSTDVMAGFPGETEDDFERSLRFVEAMAFSRLHVFRYSPRVGTAAATMPDQVATETAQARCRRLHEVGAEAERRFAASQVGRLVPVLWEAGEELGDLVRWSGLTPNYVRVLTEMPPADDLTNRIVETRLEAVIPGGLAGRPTALVEIQPPRTNRMDLHRPM